MEKQSAFIIGIIFCSLMSMFGCKSETIPTYQPYTGPLLEMENIKTLFTDSAVLRVMLKAPVQHELQDGNREFPKGLFMEFFDQSGTKTSDLKSQYGRFDKDKNLYTVTGNVIIKNVEKGEILNTEELMWYPEEKRIFTDKFVRIETEEEILTGTGLTANQDFSSYKILKPTGIFSIKEEE